MKTKTLPREVRLKILDLVDAGEEPIAVSRKLFVPVAAVHKAIVWRRHVQAHQAISKEHRSGHEAQVSAPKDKRRSTVHHGVRACIRTARLTAGCDTCGRVPDTLHLEKEGNGKFCGDHCPHCAQKRPAK